MLYLGLNIMASYTMSSKVLQYLQCLLFSITKKMFISVAKINHSEFSSHNIHVQSSLMYLLLVSTTFLCHSLNIGSFYCVDLRENPWLLFK